MEFYNDHIVTPTIFYGKVELREETGQQDALGPEEAQGEDARADQHLHQERPGTTTYRD
jgi:hypothetical protein